MKIESYSAFNPKMKRNVDVIPLIDQSLYELESMLKFVFNNKPDKFKQYLSLLEELLSSHIQDYSVEVSSLDLIKIKEELLFIFNYSNIVNLSLKVICHHLDIPKNHQFNDQFVNALIAKEKSAPFLLKYFGIKALQGLLTDEGGIVFYKEYCQWKYQDTGRKKNPRTAKQARKDQLEEFTNQGLYDLNFVIFDDENYLLKVTRCFFHEVFKPFNDPIASYLTCCYTGPDAIRKDNQYLRMKRTQTLFDGDFCDEFYWNNKIHNNPEQPTLEFLRELK